MKLQLTIKGTSNLPKWVKLPAGRAMIIPLFSLKSPSSLADAFWSLSINEKDAIWFYNNNQLKSEKLSWKPENLDIFLSYQVIANLDEKQRQEVIFSPTTTEHYTQETTTITSHARFKATELSRESKITNKLPDFLLSDNYLTVGQ